MGRGRFLRIGGSRPQSRLCLEISSLAGILEESPERLQTRSLGLLNALARLEQLYGQNQLFRLVKLRPPGVAAMLSIPLRRLPPGAVRRHKAVPPEVSHGTEPRFDAAGFPRYNQGVLSAGR